MGKKKIPEVQDGGTFAVQVTDDVNELTVKTIGDQMADFIGRVNGLLIDSHEGEVEAINLLDQGTKSVETMEAKRKQIVEPADKFVRHINGMFRPIRKRIEGGVEILRAGLPRYHDLQKTEAEKSAVQPDASVATDSGASVSYGEDITVEVTDLAALPREYMMADMGKLNAMAAAGVRNIPGVTIKTKSTIRFRKAE